MSRGDLYRVRRPAGDAKRSRVFVVVSRPTLIYSRSSTLICAPVFTRRDGLSTQVDVGIGEGLKHESSIHCDALMSIPRAALGDYVGTVSPAVRQRLDAALRVALALE